MKLLFDFSPSSDVGWNFPDQGNDRTSELFSTKTKRKVFLEKTSIHLAKNYFFMKSFGAAKNQDLTKMSSKNTSNLQLWPRAMGNRFFTLWSPLVSQGSSIRAKKSWICPYNRCRAENLGFDSLIGATFGWFQRAGWWVRTEIRTRTVLNRAPHPRDLRPHRAGDLQRP